VEDETGASEMSLDRTEWERRETALITGASEGIGFELTKLFACNGYNLVLVARNEAKLNQISEDLSRDYGISAKVVPRDLSKSAAPYEIYDELKRDGVRVSILVNNAGYIVHGPFAETELCDELDMLQVLVGTPIVLTRLFLQDMLQGNGGKILNVGSVCSFHPGPFSAAYYASKAFILSFSHAIAEELADKNITVTVLCPGVTRTQFYRRGNMENLFVAKYGVMSAEKVAEIGYKALMSHKRHVVPGIANKFFVFIGRICSWSFRAKVVKAFMS
jgi:short-subunit dehydrogenase